MKKIHWFIIVGAFMFLLNIGSVNAISEDQILARCKNICPPTTSMTYRSYQDSSGQWMPFDRTACLDMCGMFGGEGTTEDFIAAWADMNDVPVGDVTMQEGPTSTPTSTPSGSGSIFEFPNPLQIDTIQELIEAILKWMFIFSVPVAVFFILYAGYLYMTSGGDTKKLDQAKKTILYALIGFAIILVARSIPYLINDILGGSSATPTTTSESVTEDETPTGSDNEPLMACYRDCEDSFTSGAFGSGDESKAIYDSCKDECDTRYQGTP